MCPVLFLKVTNLPKCNLTSLTKFASCYSTMRPPPQLRSPARNQITAAQRSRHINVPIFPCDVLIPFPPQPASHQTNPSRSLLTFPQPHNTHPPDPTKHRHHHHHNHPKATMGIIQTAMIAASGIYAVKSLEKTVVRTQRSQNRNDPSYSNPASSTSSNQNNNRPRFDDGGAPPNYYYDQDQNQNQHYGQNQNYNQGVNYDRRTWGPGDGMGSGQGWQPTGQYGQYGQYDASRGGNAVDYGDVNNQRRGCEGCDGIRRKKSSGN